jgi:hypothetical protein
MPTGTIKKLTLAQQLLDTIDAQFGLHPGFRPVHAKGLMCSGTFTPSAEAAKLTRVPHASRPSTAVTVRNSNSTGVPTIPDNDPMRSEPPFVVTQLATLALFVGLTLAATIRFHDEPARAASPVSFPAR